MAQLFIDRLPGRQVFIALLVLPVVVSPIVSGATWSLHVRPSLRADQPDHRLDLRARTLTLLWTISPNLVYPAIIAAEVWQWTPFMFLLLLAALANVDKSQLEAAAIDGAGWWRTFFRIVLPAIWPVMAIAILIRGLDLFRLFDIVWALTKGGPGTMTETISIFTYIKGFQQFETSYTAAVAFLVIILLSVVVMLALKRVELSQMMTVKQRHALRTGLRLTAAVAITLIFLFPIYWLFMISFKTPEEIYSFPPKWYPGRIHFDNYAVLFKDGDAITVWNSFVVAGVSTVIAMFLGTICAYSLARFRTGGEHLANWIISQRMIPPIAVVFPIFLLYVWLRTGRYLHRRDSALHRLQPAVRDLDDARLHSRHPQGAGGIRTGRRLHPLAGDLESGVSDVPRRPVRDRDLYLRVRLERFHLRAGADAHRGHHLHGAGHPLLRRPVELLGQDFGDVGAGHGADFHRGGVHAALSRARYLTRCGEGLGEREGVKE